MLLESLMKTVSCQPTVGYRLQSSVTDIQQGITVRQADYGDEIEICTFRKREKVTADLLFHEVVNVS